MHRIHRLAAIASLCVAAAAVHAQSDVDAGLDALLDAQRPEDVAGLRKALAGPLSVHSALLFARAKAGSARRSALIETRSSGFSTVTLLVDRGTEAWMYEWSSLVHSCGCQRDHEVGNSLSEITAAGFEEAWKVLEGRKQGPPALDRAHGGEQADSGYDGVVQMQAGSQRRQYLISPDDEETLRRSSKVEDFIFGKTVLGLGEYHPGVRRTPAWLSEFRRSLYGITGTPRNKQQRALHESVVAGRWDEAGALVQAGADPDFLRGDGTTLLTWAVEAGRCDVATHLVALGADPAKPDFMGDIPAELAKRPGANGRAACPELPTDR